MWRLVDVACGAWWVWPVWRLVGVAYVELGGCGLCGVAWILMFLSNFMEGGRKRGMHSDSQVKHSAVPLS